MAANRDGSVFVSVVSVIFLGNNLANSFRICDTYSDFRLFTNLSSVLFRLPYCFYKSNNGGFL